MAAFDLNAAWNETFALWNARVPTDVATAVADAVAKALKAVPKPKAAKAALDIDAMTDKQLLAYRKRTSPAADLAFFLRANMSPELRARAMAIRKPDRNTMAPLRAAWRTERLVAERVAAKAA